MICTILYIMCIILSSSDWEDAMDVKETVACNLRRLRDNRKLSLDAAAQLTGVSKSMLGQIERGDVNPTISVLWKIANGLKISFSALLERAEGGTSVVRAAEASPLLEDAGNYRNYPVFPFDETHPFELYRIEIEPGGHLEAAPHLPGTEESITVFSGDAAVSVDGTDYPLGPGDSIRFAADRPHGYRNAGTGTVELSMVIFYGR